jgi:hypothetical protein
METMRARVVLEELYNAIEEVGKFYGLTFNEVVAIIPKKKEGWEKVEK